MKNYFIATLTSLFLISHAWASNEVKFSGAVSDVTCNFMDGNGMPEWQSKTITLPPVNASELNQIGSYAGEVPFMIYMECYPMEEYETAPISLRLLGHQVTPAGALGNIWSNPGSRADNVSIQILEYEKLNDGYTWCCDELGAATVLDLSQGVVVTNKNNTGISPIFGVPKRAMRVHLGARYYAEFGAAGPGFVQGVVEVEVGYH